MAQRTHRPPDPRLSLSQLQPWHSAPATRLIGSLMKSLGLGDIISGSPEPPCATWQRLPASLLGKRVTVSDGQTAAGGGEAGWEKLDGREGKMPSGSGSGALQTPAPAFCHTVQLLNFLRSEKTSLTH